MKKSFPFCSKIAIIIRRETFDEVDMGIFDYLNKHRLILDGAMGTYFAQKEGKENAVSEYALFSEAEKIKEIHREYIEAGANLIKTNTFMLNKNAMPLSANDLTKMIKKACQIAREAIEESKKEVFLAGEIGPIMADIESDDEEILTQYKEIIDVFLEEKVDAILFETFSQLQYLEQLATYIKSYNSKVLVITSFCINKNGYTIAGLSAKKLLSKVAHMDSVDVCGFNCGIGSGHMYQVITELELPHNKYVMIAPNAGYPEQLHNRMVFMKNAQFFAENAKKLLDLGVAIIGACCGSTPEFIQKIASFAGSYEPVLLKKADRYKDIQVNESSRSNAENPSVTVSSADHPINPSNNPLLTKLMLGEKVVAVELDPPYDADDRKFLSCGKALSNQKVDILTLADSPRGRSRIDSIMMSVKLNRVCRMDVMPHVCCRDRNMIAMRSSLLGAYVNDIRNLLIVTGDPVPGESRSKVSNVFDYNSIRLMEFVKEMNEEHFFNDPFIYGGALNYSGTNVDKIIERMERKLLAGASYFLTQPVYSEKDMERIALLRERTGAKILAGIMPFVSYNNANFVKNEFAGIDVPDNIVARYHKEMSREEAELVGVALASELVEKVSQMSDGYYFMLPFNRVSMMEKITIVR